MIAAFALFATVTLAAAPAQTPAAAPEDGWSKAADAQGVVVLSRQTSRGVQEMKAQGVIDAPPAKVMEVLNDHDHYVRFFPYTEESRIVGREPDGKTIYFYSLLSMPFISKRDYVLKVTDQSDWRGGKGFLKTAWTVAPDHAPAPKDGVVRVLLNDGYWLLEPRDNGTRTFATYYLLTDPGGSVPRFIVNQANASAVPDVFKALRTEVAKR